MKTFLPFGSDMSEKASSLDIRISWNLASRFKSTNNVSLTVIALTPQGIALSINGGILTCFWNNETGERSFGKVVKLDKYFEIFTDKNRPLYVCPTHITENGNADISVYFTSQHGRRRHVEIPLPRKLKRKQLWSIWHMLQFVVQHYCCCYEKQ